MKIAIDESSEQNISLTNDSVNSGIAGDTISIEMSKIIGKEKNDPDFIWCDEPQNVSFTVSAC